MTDMTREQALANAIEAAQATTGAPGHYPALAQAWAQIASLLPDSLPEIPDAMPVREGHDVGDENGAWTMSHYGVTVDGPILARCVHGHECLLNDGRWLHPYAVTVCDSPPEG